MNLDRIKEIQMAYVLNKEFGYTKVSIANMMGISPQQIGTWIREMEYVKSNESRT